MIAHQMVSCMLWCLGLAGEGAYAGLYLGGRTPYVGPAAIENLETNVRHFRARPP